MRTQRTLVTVALLAGLIVVPGGLTLADSYTLWVNDNDPNGGSYSPPGTSCNNPGHSTITAAVAAAIAGDRISVCAGLYTGPITVPATTPGLRFRGSDRAVVTSSGTDPGFMVEAGADNVVIEKLTIKNTGGSGIEVRANGVRVKNNKLLNNGDPTVSNTLCAGGRGINFENVSNVVVEKNTVSRPCRAGIRLRNVHLAIVANNMIVGSRSRPGIPVRTGSTSIVIRKNESYSNAEAGISIQGSTGNIIKRNTMFGNGLDPRLPPNGSDTDADDNTSGSGTAGTGNRWERNVCETDQPDGLCDDDY